MSVEHAGRGFLQRGTNGPLQSYSASVLSKRENTMRQNQMHSFLTLRSVTDTASAFARQFPRRFGDALCYRSVLIPTIGSTTHLDRVFDFLESHFPAASHSSSLSLRYRIRGAPDGTRAFSWRGAEN
jgi:hypothetical protein